MESEVKITAHADKNQPDACKFRAEATLHEGGATFFPDSASAKGSPLAERLFAIENVISVRISKNEVKLTKTGEEPWRSVGGKVATALREHLKSGKLAVAKDYASKTRTDAEIKIKVQEILDADINPGVAEHGGVIDLLDVREGKVYVKMGGSCQGCGQASVTLKQGVEASIRKAVPEVEDILDTTDHASGTNPYYAPSKK